MKQKKTKTSTTSKKTAKKKTAKRPGVIASILDIIQKNGPISKEGILLKLTKLFPDRPAEGMKSTINVQVPSRLNKEKKAKIKKNSKGKYFIK